MLLTDLLKDPDFDGVNIEALLELLQDPDRAEIEADRAIVAAEGLRGFIPLAWHAVEGSETSYKGNWHIEAMCEHLEAVSRGEIRRLAIAVPPRSMKSLAVSVMWPAYDWIKNPWRRFLFASYAHNLSMRDSTKCRRVIMSPWFQARWGDKFKLTGDQNTKVKFENNKQGFRLSTSVGGQLTGEGGDFVICDDPNNAHQAESQAVREGTNQWWDEAMSTRLNNHVTGAYVVIQQRVHHRDMLGHILAKPSPIPWTYLCLPAEYEPDHPHRWIRDPRKEPGELLWPEHMPRESLEAIKISLGPYAAAGQLQQRPSPREGGIFKRGWFSVVPVAPADVRWVRGWDFAATSAQIIKADPDYSASGMVGYSPSTKLWYIQHVERFREDPEEVERRFKQRADLDGIAVHVQIPQDPGQAGKSQARNLIRLLPKHSVVAQTVTGDKLSRALPWAAKAGAGLVALVDGTWIDDFLVELTSFPTGAHDDMVDAVSAAFERLLSSSSAVVDYYRQQMLDQGVDPATVEAAAALPAKPDGHVRPGQQAEHLAAVLAAMKGKG